MTVYTLRWGRERRKASVILMGVILMRAERAEDLLFPRQSSGRLQLFLKREWGESKDI